MKEAPEFQSLADFLARYAVGRPRGLCLWAGDNLWTLECVRTYVADDGTMIKFVEGEDAEPSYFLRHALTGYDLPEEAWEFLPGDGWSLKPETPA